MGNGKLWKTVENSPVLATITFDMPGNASRDAREIEQTLQSTRVLLKAPYRPDGKLSMIGRPRSMKMMSGAEVAASVTHS